jgi:hypothetical protein
VFFVVQENLAALDKTGAGHGHSLGRTFFHARRRAAAVLKTFDQTGERGNAAMIYVFTYQKR